MNFAAAVGSSLRSGYALPVRRPDSGTLRNQPAGDPLIESGTLYRRSRPPLQADNEDGDADNIGRYRRCDLSLHKVIGANAQEACSDDKKQGRRRPIPLGW